MYPPKALEGFLARHKDRTARKFTARSALSGIADGLRQASFRSIAEARGDADADWRRRWTDCFEQPGEERSKRCFHLYFQQPGVPDAKARPGGRPNNRLGRLHQDFGEVSDIIREGGTPDDRKGGPMKRIMDDHRGRKRPSQLRMVPSAVRSTRYSSCP